jgi:hypothetical protein
MQTTHISPRSTIVRRAAYGMAAMLLLAAAMIEIFTNDAGWWQFFALGFGPDIALFAGISSSLEKGQLHPRAVPLYNALHSFRWPALLAVAAVIWLPLGWLAGALAWGLHIALDRSIGYGPRTHDGFQQS